MSYWIKLFLMYDNFFHLLFGICNMNRHLLDDSDVRVLNILYSILILIYYRKVWTIQIIIIKQNLFVNKSFCIQASLKNQPKEDTFLWFKGIVSRQFDMLLLVLLDSYKFSTPFVTWSIFKNVIVFMSNFRLLEVPRWVLLKGQCHEIFDPRFFFVNRSPLGPRLTP
jgi:hypothetical protein